MSVLNIRCPRCNQQYEQQGSKRQPRILPCGYSYCSLCVISDCADNGYFYCDVCDEKIQAQILKYAPINKMYYQIMEQVVEYLRVKQWQYSQSKNQRNTLTTQQVRRDKNNAVKLQDKCLYIFCQRRRFQCNKMKQIFCSQNCKIKNQQLYE